MHKIKFLEIKYSLVLAEIVLLNGRVKHYKYNHERKTVF